MSSSHAAAPIVSVVTVTFNAEDSIGITRDSVLGQAVEGIEWLIVDGKSSDKTLGIVGADRVERGIAVRSVSEKDRGLYDAMNKALHLATGRYVIFMNSGDRFTDLSVISDFIELLYVSNDAPVMVYGHTVVELSDGKLFLRRTRPLEYIWHGQPTIHQSVFFRRDVHLDTLYPFETYPVSSDYAVMAKIQLDHKDQVVCWDRSVAVFKNDPNSFGNRQFLQRLRDAWNAQRDVTGTPFHLRIASALKRTVANVFYNFR